MTNSPSKKGYTQTAARFEHDHLLSHKFDTSYESILPPTIQDQQLACSQHAFPISNNILSLPVTHINIKINKNKQKTFSNLVSLNKNISS